MEGNEEDRLVNMLREVTNQDDNENSIITGKIIYTFITRCRNDAPLCGYKKHGTAYMQLGMQFETSIMSER
jgi:hypothetical protein